MRASLRISASTTNFDGAVVDTSSNRTLEQFRTYINSKNTNYHTIDASFDYVGDAGMSAARRKVFNLLFEDESALQYNQPDNLRTNNVQSTKLRYNMPHSNITLTGEPGVPGTDGVTLGATAGTANIDFSAASHLPEEKVV